MCKTCGNALRRCTKITKMVFLLFSFTLIVKGSALTYSVGVKVGDWAEYDLLSEWVSNPPQTKPTDAEQEKQVNYTRVEVKNIYGTKVTIHKITHFKNGSERIDVHIGDIKNGAGNLSVQIIASGLEEGDRVSEAPDSAVIKKTFFENYAGATREVNWNRTWIRWGLGNLSIIDLYWDKKTGFLCELGILTDLFVENYNITSFSKWKMNKTNLWKPGTNTNIPISEWAGVIVFVAIITGVIYFVFKKPLSKRLKRRRLKKTAFTRYASKLVKS